MSAKHGREFHGTHNAICGHWKREIETTSLHIDHYLLIEYLLILAFNFYQKSLIPMAGQAQVKQ